MEGLQYCVGDAAPGAYAACALLVPMLLCHHALQGPVGKSNLARFLWNVMALGTSTGQTGATCDPFKQLCPADQVTLLLGQFPAVTS
jgi:hypothetical protein